MCARFGSRGALCCVQLYSFNCTCDSAALIARHFIAPKHISLAYSVFPRTEVFGVHVNKICKENGKWLM
jgi:hypothetical protein